MVSSSPRPHFTLGNDPVPIVQEAGWAPGPVWTGGKSRPHRHSIPDRPARSQSLYRLRYRARTTIQIYKLNSKQVGLRRGAVQALCSGTLNCICWQLLITNYNRNYFFLWRCPLIAGRSLFILEVSKSHTTT